VFVPGESFQSGLDLRVGSGAYNRETSALLTNIILGWGRLARNKNSSLFGHFVSDEKFNKIFVILIHKAMIGFGAGHQKCSKRLVGS